MGETRVRILVYEVRMKSRRPLVYFHPHENEHGSAVVTRHIIREDGGRLVEIRCQGDRLITFKLKGKSYTFDPDRMFTEVGLQSSLAHFAPIGAAPLNAVIGLRNAVLKELGDGSQPIISVHNNYQNGVSISSYQENGMYAAHAAKVAVNEHEGPRNFFIVLEPGLYSRLYHAGFNTVLQSPHAPDDGSLSILAQRDHWVYVNVEAAEGNMNQQQRMLEALEAAMT